MHIRIATAPGTWGVESAGDPANPPWPAVLSEIAELGFEGSELGPFGYLPTDGDQLAGVLAAHRLHLVAGFVMEPFHRKAHTERILGVARRTCGLLRDGGAEQVVLIGALAAERARCAGRPDDAPRLDAARQRDMVTAIERTAEVAEEHGLRAVFHPHAGTYVEFLDEVERLMSELDDAIGLCLDTGHCAYAGIDPVDLVQTYGARVGHLHLKDVRSVPLGQGLSFADAVAAGVFCPLGAGDVDFVAVRDALAGVAFDGWATVEQDRLAGHGSARADAAASLDHLRQVGMVTSAVIERAAST